MNGGKEMANIGKPLEEIEVVPLEAPIEMPEPTEAPAEPEPVPEKEPVPA